MMQLVFNENIQIQTKNLLLQYKLNLWRPERSVSLLRLACCLFLNHVASFFNSWLNKHLNDSLTFTAAHLNSASSLKLLILTLKHQTELLILSFFGNFTAVPLTGTFSPQKDWEDTHMHAHTHTHTHTHRDTDTHRHGVPRGAGV